MKDVYFAGSSLNDIKGFPKPVQERVGYQIHKVQNGEEPSDWKPMKSIGPGVREIRIKVGDQYRVIYIASFAEGIYVLHVFHKKTQKTSKKDIDIATQRLKEIQKAREVK